MEVGYHFDQPRLLGIPATYFTPSGQSAPVSNALYPYWSGQISTGYIIGLVASNGGATLSQFLRRPRTRCWNVFMERVLYWSHRDRHSCISDTCCS
jgi:hypothetical protein